MASELDTLKNTIMTVVNGQVSPATIAVQAAQDAAKSVMAEARYMLEITKTVVPQQAKLAGEIATLEGQKATKEASLSIKEAEVSVIDTTMEVQKGILEVAKKKEVVRRKKQDKDAAKAKARGEAYNPPSTGSDDNIRAIKEKLDEQEKRSISIHNEMDAIRNEISDIENQIEEKQGAIRLLTAQLSPAASLAEAKAATNRAQSKVDNATTPEAREMAQKELEKAQSEESSMQAISDDHDTAVENNKDQNEPKMMQLRAEYQIMDSGVAVLNYLITNLPVLCTSITTVPSTVVAGSATGVANPVFAPMWGNVLYGYAFFILATVKAASIRFLALAHEIQYTPTTEMTIINMIAPVEASLKGVMASLPAPAGTTLI